MVAIRVILFALLCVTGSRAQNWRALGPDTALFRGVYGFSASFATGADYRVAAWTMHGLAIYRSTTDTWTYVGRRLPADPYCFPPGGLAFYPSLLVHSPWETDSAFIGFTTGCFEPAQVISKIGLPVGPDQALGTPGLGYCFISRMTLFIPPGPEPVVYASVCGIHRSTDGGASWALIDSAIFFYEDLLVGVDRVDRRVLYKEAVGPGYSGILKRSTDEGASWTTVLGGLPASGSYDFGRPSIVIDAGGDTIILGVRKEAGDTSTMRGIFRSPDGGLTWDQPWAGEDVVALARRGGTDPTIRAATRDRILVSKDAGLSWSVELDSLPVDDITEIVSDPFSDTLLVSSASAGVFRVWNPGTGVIDQPVPPGYLLLSNYPNPFNPSTTIEFTLPEAGSVRISVYDLLGREIETLVDRRMPAGTHRVRWDAAGRPAGVYLCRLTAGSGLRITRMVHVQ